MSKSLMCHVVAGYPNFDICLDLMKRIEKLDVKYVEIQIPFSDPIADGELIMVANDVAVSNGITTEKAFDMLNHLTTMQFKPDIFIMSYLQKIFHFGFEDFCSKLAQFNVQGIIVPDLPYDTLEFELLLKYSLQSGVTIVPVISPGIKQSRLDKILEFKPKFVYITSQKGTTGKRYHHSAELIKVARAVRKFSDAKIMIGFGIKSAEDVSNALSLGDIAIIGSSLVKSLQESSLEQTILYIDNLITSSTV